MPTDRVVIKAVGDICLQAVPNDPFSKLGDLLTADITFGNLECCLTTRSDGRDKPEVLSAPPERAADLAAAGFDVVCLANNHSLDFGPAGLRDTLDALADQPLALLGGGRTEREATETLWVERSGRKVAFVSTTDAAGSDPAGPSIAVISLKALADQIRTIRAQADAVVASFHGGIEMDETPSAFVVRSLRALVDAGADVVLGHHPHVLQGVERYRDKFIAYSLGNFMFDNRRYFSDPELTAKSAVCEVALEWHGGALTIDPKFHAVQIENDFLPRPAPEQQADREATLDRLSAALAMVDVSAPDAARMEGFASDLHRKSFGTIVRYGIKHFRDFSAAEILMGVRLVVRNTVRRLFGKAKQ